MDNCDELMLARINFAKGAADSENLPLNISRETPRQNEIPRVIEKKLVKKCREMSAETAAKRGGYKRFREQSGERLAPGARDDSINRTEVAEPMRR